MKKELYNNLLRCMPLPCIIGKIEDKDIEIIYVNNKFYEKADKVDYINSKFSELLQEYDKKEFISALNKCNEIKKEIECFVFVPILFNFYNIKIKKLDEGLYMLTFYDYIKVEKSIMHTILHQKKTMVYIEDKYNRLIYYNDVAESFYSKQYNILINRKYIGSSIYDVLGNNTSQKILDDNYSVISGRRKTTSSIREINGISLINYVFPFNVNGRLEGVIVVEYNIDDSTNISSLRISKELMFEQLIDTLPYGIFYIDSNYKFKYCNESMCKILHITKDEIMDKKSDTTFRENSVLNLLSLYNEDVLVNRKTAVYTENISDKCIQITKVPFYDEYLELAGICGIIRNVTKTSKIKEETRQLSLQFYSNLMHEFMTPINLIFSFIQLMEGNFAKEKESQYYDKYIKYFDVIKNSTLLLFSMINNIILATEIDTNIISYSPQNQDIVAFTERILNNIFKYNSSIQNMIFDTNEEEHIMAFDSSMMEMVILNGMNYVIKHLNVHDDFIINLDIDKDWVSLIFENIYFDEKKIEYETIKKTIEKYINANKSLECNSINLFVTVKLIGFHNGKIKIKKDGYNKISVVYVLPNKKI